jgi:hypothetical protein
MLVLDLKTAIPLAEPCADLGLVTWFDIAVRRADLDAQDLVGSARIAMIHVAESLDRGVPIIDALDADSEELLSLHDVFFDSGGLKDSFIEATGSNVLYVSSIELLLPWRGRRIEEALVRRIADTLGQGCAIAIVPVADASEASRWREIGFAIARAPADGLHGYAYLDLALAHPELMAADDDGHRFEVVGDRAD